MEVTAAKITAMPNAMESRARIEREVMAKLHTRIFARQKLYRPRSRFKRHMPSKGELHRLALPRGEANPSQPSSRRKEACRHWATVVRGLGPPLQLFRIESE